MLVCVCVCVCVCVRVRALFLVTLPASAKRFHMSQSLLWAISQFLLPYMHPPTPIPSISPNFTLSLVTFSIYCPPSVNVIRRITGDQREESWTSTTDLSPRFPTPFSFWARIAFLVLSAFLFDIVLSAVFTAVTALVTQSSACKQ